VFETIAKERMQKRFCKFKKFQKRSSAEAVSKKAMNMPDAMRLRYFFFWWVFRVRYVCTIANNGGHWEGAAKET